MKFPYASVSLSFFLLTGCTTLTPRFKGSLFLHHQLPEDAKDLNQYGIYRKLVNGEEEYLPYTDKNIVNYLSIHKDDFILVMPNEEE